MRFTKFVTPACCGRTSLRAELGEPITPRLVTLFKGQGFAELEHFTKVGMMYVESQALIVTGPIGSNKIQIKCKGKECSQDILQLESFLISI
jgi:hypothetical protein